MFFLFDGFLRESGREKLPLSRVFFLVEGIEQLSVRTLEGVVELVLEGSCAVPIDVLDSFWRSEGQMIWS